MKKIILSVLTALCLVGPHVNIAQAEDSALTPQKKAKLLAKTSGTWATMNGRKDVASLVMDGKGAYKAKDAAGKTKLKGSLQVAREIEDVFVYILCDEKGKETEGNFALFFLDKSGKKLHFGNGDGFEYKKIK